MFIMKFYKVYTEIFKSIFVFFIKEKIFKKNFWVINSLTSHSLHMRNCEKIL